MIAKTKNGAKERCEGDYWVWDKKLGKLAVLKVVRGAREWFWRMIVLGTGLGENKSKSIKIMERKWCEGECFCVGEGRESEDRVSLRKRQGIVL